MDRYLLSPVWLFHPLLHAGYPGATVLSPSTSRADCGRLFEPDQGRVPPPAREASVRRHPPALHLAQTGLRAPEPAAPESVMGNEHDGPRPAPP